MVTHPDELGDGAGARHVREPEGGAVLIGQPDRMRDVGLRPAPAVRPVGPEAVPEGLDPPALAHVGRDVDGPDLPGGRDAVEAFREPIGLAVVKDDDRREGRAFGHGLGVLRDGVRVDTGPALCAAVQSDQVQA
jgi:hypothetical protein